jgi:hypothetical protein
MSTVHAISDNTLGDTVVAVYQRKTILTDAQIKTLPTEYIEVVPPPGAGKLLSLSHVMIVGKNIEPYDNSGFSVGGAIIVYGIGWEADASAEIPTFSSMLLTNGNSVLTSPAIAGVLDSSVQGFGPTPLGDKANKGLFIAGFTDANAPYTGGDPGNTMEITVFYSIIDI